MKPAKDKEPTYTHRVLSALVALNDFATSKQLRAITKIPSQGVLQSLYYLKKRQAVDAVSVEDVLHWFATPETDQRLKTFE